MKLTNKSKKDNNEVRIKKKPLQNKLQAMYHHLSTNFQTGKSKNNNKISNKN
ncbi:1796_t:CDS:2 [Cetraspora pellucida]|uniref:1796_t:CDS:1 n=1 Tax=Cetraspora pellucida TaxID=1433469 RepID=A0A9N9CB42_9GLOM|nr:1796_t:CDS:2 [Cetraspora pellucida]